MGPLDTTGFKVKTKNPSVCEAPDGVSKNEQMNKSNFSSYLEYSLHLAAKPRRGVGNMFRHQVVRLAIL